MGKTALFGTVWIGEHGSSANTGRRAEVGMTPDQQIEKIDQILGMLSARATGSFPNDLEYRELRDELLDDSELASQLPSVVRSHRSLDDWWGFIRTRFEKYDERRAYLRDQFEPLLQELEEQRRAVRKKPRKPVQEPIVEDNRPDDLDNLPQRKSARDLERKRIVLAPGGKFVPIEPARKTGAAVGPGPVAARSKRVFVVHGHDDGAKDSVDLVLRKQGLEPIILHQQANRGRTVIEKFEAYADVGFAVAILTPDDVGRASEDADLRPRARQNVIFEMGFFFSALKRENVVALLGAGVEQPSDFTGIIYITLDRHRTWKQKLLRELHAAGYDIDFSKE
jgi:hypothetical protein